MHKNNRVLSFEISFQDSFYFKVLEKLEHFEKAPMNIVNASSEESLKYAVLTLLNGRTISSSRWDYEEILKATNCKSSLELSLKGHGLSLSDHYWYKKENEDLKYENINFFENEWDDSFGRAILNGDYEALRSVSLNVPDIVISGWAAKAWILENGERYLYKLGINKGNYDECLGEVLASRCAIRLFGEKEVVKYELKQVNGTYASVSKCIVNIDDEMIPIDTLLPIKLKEMYYSGHKDRDIIRKFLDQLREMGLNDLYETYVKIMCLKTLIFVNDFHFHNVSILRNIETGATRIAPLYDLGGAYGSGEKGKQILSNINTGTLFLVYFVYGMLEPEWDYSWYDSSKLDGFEDELKEVLSKSEFYTPVLIENIINVYHHQKRHLDEMANNQKEKMNK